MLDALPFMPEMFQYCGQRFEVFKRADKTCDTIGASVSRRMRNAVHLKGLRCDGQYHGGCEASCLLFWKEAWLTRVPAEPIPSSNGRTSAAIDSTPHQWAETQVHTCVRRAPDCSASSETIYRCQATELNRATRFLPWWDVRQYVRELRSGNVEFGQFLRVVVLAAFNVLLRWTVRRTYPSIRGKLARTPIATTNLRVGEVVRVKSKKEIEATLDVNKRNRGLYFDREMVKYCEKEFKVLKRVSRIVDEKTGRLIELPRDCIVLDGVVCCGDVSTKRLFCPRSIYPYWREIWLTRVDDSC
jgi:hypothetical protein